MTTRAVALQTRRRAADLALPAGFVMFAVAAALAFGVMIQEPTRVRIAVGSTAGLAALALGRYSPRHLLYAVVVWLTLLGLLRRVVTLDAPPSKADPILLVGPFALGLLALAAIDRGVGGRRSFLTKSVFALQVLIILGALNPLQRSPLGGIAGLLFVLVPTFGFWIGRGLCDDRTLARVLRIVAVLAVFVALYGLAQTLVRFPSWDRLWINGAGVGSLNVHGVIRPFGSLSSAAEYGTFIAVGLIIWLAYSFRPVVAPLAAPALVLLAVAVFLESSRGLVVMSVAAIGFVVAARARLPGLASVAVAAALLAGLGYGIKHIAPSSFGSGKSSVLVAHQVNGLSNPLDPNASTATTHYSMMINGFRAGIHNPFGEGIGTITIAGARFGGVTAGTELDPSNMGLSLGIPGMVVYLLVVIAGFRTLYGRARTRGDALSVAALGVAAVTAMQWLNGGQYAVAILPWLVLGWADRSGERASE